jgi:NitT/TauT family transport system substrate-binding protein
MIEVEAYCSTLLDGDPRMTGSVSSQWCHRRWRLCLALAALAGVLAVAGCSSSPPPKVPAPEPVTLRLGYVTELADAPALAGLQMGFIGSGAGDLTVDAVPFTSPVAEARAMARGQLDAAYLDPVLAVAVWESAGDGGIKVIAGSASGGTELVVKKGITVATQLAGQRVAAPAGTAGQAALDWWLRQNGIDADSPGDVTMTGAYLAHAISHGQLAAAWEPAPLDAQMAAAGGQVLLNEASLWPGGEFATAVLAVTSKFLAAHPAQVTGLLRGDLEAVRYLDTDPSPAHVAAAKQLTEAARTALPAAVLTAGFTQLQFTVNPLAATMFAEAQHAAAAAMVQPVPSLRVLAGLFDLGPLNQLLKAARQPLVNL